MRLRKKNLGVKNIIGKKVSEERRNKGMNQKEFLAKLQLKGLNLSASGLSKLEGQIRFVTDKELVVIAEVLNITTDALLGHTKRREKKHTNATHTFQ